MSKALTVGTPWRVIVLFAIPLLIGNVVQQLYQVADAWVVGRHLGVDALAAVGTTGALLFLLIGFAWGMTTGFAIPTAQAFGASDERGVRESVAAGTILTAGVSLLISVAAPLMARPVLELLRTPPELLDDAVLFAAVSFAGASTTMFFNYLAAIIRAMGDSRTPLFFLAASCLANIGLVVLFVQTLGLGLAGAAIATILAQAIAVVLCLIYVHVSIPLLHVRREDWRRGMDGLARHLRIGLPMGFQASIIAIGTLVVQLRLNLLGSQAVAAYTTATRVDGLAVAFLASLGLAVSTFVAQNYGAGHFDRIRTGVRQGTEISIALGIVLAILLIAIGNTVVRSFVGPGEEVVVAMAHEYLVANGLLYFLLGILFVTRGALQGSGNTLLPLFSGILELLFRVAVAIYLGQVFGFSGVIWGNPLAWVGACILLIPAWVMAQRAMPLGDSAEVLVEKSADMPFPADPNKEVAACA